jgi:hypothetical protein
MVSCGLPFGAVVFCDSTAFQLIFERVQPPIHIPFHAS